MYVPYTVYVTDEFHNLFHCADIIFIKIREYNAYLYISTHNKMFNISNTTMLSSLCKYFEIIIERVSSLG